MHKLFDKCYPYCVEVIERNNIMTCLKNKITISKNTESCSKGNLCLFAIYQLNMYPKERYESGGTRESERFE